MRRELGKNWKEKIREKKEDSKRREDGNRREVEIGGKGLEREKINKVRREGRRGRGERGEEKRVGKKEEGARRKRE